MPHAPMIPSTLSSFLLGVAATLVVGVAVRRVGKDKKDTTKQGSATTSSFRSRDMMLDSSESNGNNNNTRETQSTDLMDSPDLDLRLIRKAEAVIQMRSGNLIVVIERSTNSWNHSACLRTAEALVRSRNRDFDENCSGFLNWRSYDMCFSHESFTGNSKCVDH